MRAIDVAATVLKQVSGKMPAAAEGLPKRGVA
jgi:hypothetical protein